MSAQTHTPAMPTHRAPPARHNLGRHIEESEFEMEEESVEFQMLAGTEPLQDECFPADSQQREIEVNSRSATVEHLSPYIAPADPEIPAYERGECYLARATGTERTDAEHPCPTARYRAQDATLEIRYDPTFSGVDIGSPDEELRSGEYEPSK